MKIHNIFDYKIKKNSILVRMGYSPKKTELSDEISKLVDDIIELSYSYINPKIIENRYDFEIDGNKLIVNNEVIESADIVELLKDCDKLIIFYATLSKNFDELLDKYTKENKITESLIINSIGSQTIEQIANIYNVSLKKEFSNTTRRFSPGYGDMDLKYQLVLYKLCKANLIGIKLNPDSFLMTPVKSISAIIGLKV